MNLTIYGIIFGWLGGIAFGAMLWYAKASAYNLYLRNKIQEEDDWYSDYLSSAKKLQCECGEMSLKECATMPSRHCGLWKQKGLM